MTPKSQNLGKEIIQNIKILKDTYDDCVIGYIKSYIYKNSYQQTWVVLQINGLY